LASIYDVRVPATLYKTTSSMATPVDMPPAALYENYDDEGVFKRIQSGVLNPTTQNFVVEFGKSSAHIALDLDRDAFKELLKDSDSLRNSDRPVRWM
jgi:hypothetical protein